MAKRVPMLNEQEIALVIRTVDGYGPPGRRLMFSALYILLGNVGLRISEALSLRWQDVDFLRSELTIRSLKQGCGDHGVKRAPAPEDTLPVDPKTLAALLAYQNGGDPADRIFPISRTVAYNVWKRLLCRAGIPHVKLHGLRHGAVTRWVETGDLAFAMAMARHKSLSTTSRYTHCRMLREKFARVEPVG